MADILPDVEGGAGRRVESTPVLIVNSEGVAVDASPETAVVLSVESTTTSTQIIAADATRRGLIVANDDENTLFLLLGTGAASTASYTVPIASGGYWEAPFSWAGTVQGVWGADGTGAARVTSVS